MVYVLNQDGQPIMPTVNHAKVRVLLKKGKAKVIRRCPFTIQLLYPCDNQTQPISLGVDAGSKHIGLSATTKGDNLRAKVLYESDVTLRNDIVELLSTRRENRSSRRKRKVRYRKARYENRHKRKGWLCPSIKEKIDTHITVIANVHKILPITKITVEVASFDIQKIKNPKIQGTEYQQGEQLDFWNVREYVLWRDGHICQCCKGKSKDKVLNVHHIESRKTGGDAPNNLVTLCEYCHSQYHQGNIKLPKTIKRGASFKDAAFMGIMRWAFYNILKEMYSNVHKTYGYITKNTRIKLNLPKEHYIDARCISDYPNAVSDGIVYYQKKIRRHNRQIHKITFLKRGIRKRNQAEYIVKGFRRFDKVKFKNQICFIVARRMSGKFELRLLDGTNISHCAWYKKIKLLEISKGFLIERRLLLN